MKQIPHRTPKSRKKTSKKPSKKTTDKKNRNKIKTTGKLRLNRALGEKKTLKHRDPTEEDSTADSTVSNSPEESKIEKPFRETTGSKDDPSPNVQQISQVVPSKQQHFAAKFTFLFLLLII